MKLIKKSLSLLIIVAMILSSISTLYADATIIKFADINTSLVRQHIINVYNKGLLNGVSESSFKPLDNTTNFQVLISITRMTNAKQKYDLAELEAKYKDSVLDKYDVPVYARQETAYCLEEGIVTVNDISALKANTSATKQVISAYIAKVFGITYDPTKPIVFLAYNDSKFIVKENKAYIKYLIDIGVLSSQGDAMGNFNPDEVITRETYAKMLDVASDKYKELNPPIPDIQSDLVGTVEEVVLDGVEGAYYWRIKNGDKVFIYVNKEGKISELIVESKIENITGPVESLLATDSGVIESITYTRTSAPKITMLSTDGKIKEYFIRKEINSNVYDLRPGMNIIIELENDEIIKLTTN